MLHPSFLLGKLMFICKKKHLPNVSLAMPSPTSFPSLMAFSLRFSLGVLYEDPNEQVANDENCLVLRTACIDSTLHNKQIDTRDFQGYHGRNQQNRIGLRICNPQCKYESQLDINFKKWELENK